MPLQDPGGSGARKRSGPIGGWAKGIPLKRSQCRCDSLSIFPCFVETMLANFHPQLTDPSSRILLYVGLVDDRSLRVKLGLSLGTRFGELVHSLLAEGHEYRCSLGA
jgi:hypothetical protein